MNIGCSLNCCYMLDGSCRLSDVSQAQDTRQSKGAGCPYFVKKSHTGPMVKAELI